MPLLYNVMPASLFTHTNAHECIAYVNQYAELFAGDGDVNDPVIEYANIRKTTNQKYILYYIINIVLSIATHACPALVSLFLNHFL